MKLKIYRNSCKIVSLKNNKPILKKLKGYLKILLINDDKNQ
tara:strand:- start:2301 stop:2423 length:123 start_codon:yes stop_codon:yes gene_type:complete